MKSFAITKREILPRAEAIIEGEIPAEAVQKERIGAIQFFQSRMALDGFRKGHVPEKILVEKAGELAIYEESASRALEKAFKGIMKEAELDAVGNPRVSITKISVGNPVSFKIETAVMPKIKLPDYKETAKEISGKIEEVVVEEKEINQALDDMRRSVAHHEKHHKENNVEPLMAHEDHTGKDIPESELPALDDEFAKKLGNFGSLKVLKEKIKESVMNEKKIKAKEKNRLGIIEKIIEKTEIVLPEILVEGELSKMLSEFRANLERMGIGYDEYLTNIKRGEDDLRKEWKPEAEKRAKIQLVLRQIAKDENLEGDEDVVKKEVETILKQFKDVERTNVESYVRNMILNEEVWKFLEEQK